ncbi:hypothetical protein M422DRAFT_170720 [Sphaerobolus stellatus SS14]|uniref:Tc1-like transposase DDE domain-containing protein n=1 Tax=Sphaerobolus stellatus (strain SS14) TaxID=990650 RepID=A0A0C9V6N1_SPHS4|nr:hypothetical protein M422DRAFT_170720 [Sphaerobolus stellatus SS14]
MARSLREWVWDYLEDNGQLPFNVYRGSVSILAQDEDLAEEIHEHLRSLGKKYLTAADVVRFLATPEIRMHFNLKKTPTERTARRWMHTMEYRYGKPVKGMFIDGHERADVVDYRQGIFLPFWASIQDQMAVWDRENNRTLPALPEFPKRKRVVLVTHDESTFYAHDQRQTRWIHTSEKPEPVRKGEGSSIMVSDFMSPDLGWLKSKDGTQEARVIFKAGKNHEGYFSNEHILAQTELAIELFEDHFPGTAIAAFAFDNAPSHQKRAADALSALKMPKNPKLWRPDDKLKMRNGVLPNGEQQPLYFPDDHPTMPGYFKGMSIILQERSLIQEAKLPAQCKNFKCQDVKSACCCRRVLFNQPDFTAQKVALVELIEANGHLVFFYPKYHCELNPIEQCWGTAKYEYRKLPIPANEAQMEVNSRKCLDSVDIVKMRQFTNRSARFIDAYARGLTGAQASWANKRYHGHRVLPESIMNGLEMEKN